MSQHQQHPRTGLHLVELPNVLQNVVEEAYSGIQSVVCNLPDLSADEGWRLLLQHLHSVRQRLQRLDILVQWCHKARAVSECGSVLAAAAAHIAALRAAADELAFSCHGLIEDLTVPCFDIYTSLSVLGSGTYKMLPDIIEDQLPKEPSHDVEEALNKMNFLIRSKLILMQKLPSGMKLLEISSGKVKVAGKQYEAELSMVPCPQDTIIKAKYAPISAAAAADEESVEEISPSAADSMEIDPCIEAPRDDDDRPPWDIYNPVTWRWRLESFQFLQAGVDANVQKWLQQHVEDKMWIAGDIEQLARLGMASYVAPLAKDKPLRKDAAAESAGLSTLISVSSERKGGIGLHHPPMAGEEEHSIGMATGDIRIEDDSCRLPEWAGNPLLVMHSILERAAARVALFDALLPSVRSLVVGKDSAWGNQRVKIEKPRGGNTGIRLVYWLGVPIVSDEGGGARLSSSPENPALEIIVNEHGILEVAHDPPFDKDRITEECTSLGGEDVLRTATYRRAEAQLKAIQRKLEEVHSTHLVLSDDTSPCLEFQDSTVCLRMYLPTGTYTVSSSAQEHDCTAQQALLDKAWRDALTRPLDEGTSSRGMLAVSMVADALHEIVWRDIMNGSLEMVVEHAVQAHVHWQKASLPPFLIEPVLKNEDTAAIMVYRCIELGNCKTKSTKQQLYSAISSEWTGRERCGMYAGYLVFHAALGNSYEIQMSLAICSVTAAAGLVVQVEEMIGKNVSTNDSPPSNQTSVVRKRRRRDDGRRSNEYEVIDTLNDDVDRWCEGRFRLEEIKAQLKLLGIKASISDRHPTHLKLPSIPALAMLDKDGVNGGQNGVVVIGNAQNDACLLKAESNYFSQVHMGLSFLFEPGNVSDAITSLLGACTVHVVLARLKAVLGTTDDLHSVKIGNILQESFEVTIENAGVLKLTWQASEMSLPLPACSLSSSNDMPIPLLLLKQWEQLLVKGHEAEFLMSVVDAAAPASIVQRVLDSSTSLNNEVFRFLFVDARSIVFELKRSGESTTALLVRCNFRHRGTYTHLKAALLDDLNASSAVAWIQHMWESFANMAGFQRTGEHEGWIQIDSLQDAMRRLMEYVQ